MQPQTILRWQRAKLDQRGGQEAGEPAMGKPISRRPCHVDSLFRAPARVLRQGLGRRVAPRIPQLGFDEHTCLHSGFIGTWLDRL
jgi:hypothetical protein